MNNKTLTIYDCPSLNRSFEKYIDLNVEILILECPYELNETIIYPKTIRALILKSNCEITKYPENLEVLVIDFNFSTTRKNSKNNCLDFLPNTLKKLVIKDSCFNEPLDNLPNNLKILEFSYINREYNNLPSSLEKIIIRYDKYAGIEKIKIPFGCVIEDKYGLVINIVN